MFFTSPLAQASSNSAFEMSPLPSLSTCVKLTINGAAADFASRLPDGTALFQIAVHCSGFRAAEGRPDVMVFVCASAQVGVNGSTPRGVNGRTTREMRDVLNICLLLRSCQHSLPRWDPNPGILVPVSATLKALRRKPVVNFLPGLILGYAVTLL